MRSTMSIGRVAPFFVLAAAIGAQTVGLDAQSQAPRALLQGSIVSPVCSSDNFASGDVSGDLSGLFFVAFDCEDGSISGGTWLIRVTAEAPDGATEVLGTIRGHVLHGSFESDSGGERVTVRDVTLAITEGTGEYTSIVSGTGSLEATSDPGGTPQFTGTLGLTF
jgi:hypothetical protein